MDTLFRLCCAVSWRTEEGCCEFQPQLFNWQFFLSLTCIPTLILNGSLRVPRSYLLSFISQIRHWKKRKERKLGQHYAIPSPPCQFATLPFTEITPRAALRTLTGINSTALCATLSHWNVSSEVTIPFEVRVHFNNDFSEAKTLQHDPSKNSYSFHSEVQTSLSSFSF